MVERCSRSIRKDKEQGVLLRPLLPEATYLRLKEFRTASNLRYILSAKFSNVSGADWFSVFSDDAENIIGCSADELEKMKSQLTKASWAPKLP
ncbi:replication factor-A protein [Artemisia annua]|uniref:Replication factor-A protein n=1 Tax=Artemisia annua TaxID=35608 RepID=A0A2U1MXY2_ARTAN|nr:replication factor-A protein [Artemisia annua]